MSQEAVIIRLQNEFKIVELKRKITECELEMGFQLSCFLECSFTQRYFHSHQMELEERSRESLKDDRINYFG